MLYIPKFEELSWPRASDNSCVADDTSLFMNTLGKQFSRENPHETRDFVEGNTRRQTESLANFSC